MLYIKLFGPPMVFDDDRPVLIQRRLPRLLLFYLAGQGKPVRRAELTGLFWPDEPENKARQNLRDNLSKLRRDLPAPIPIQTQPEIISIEFNRVSVDYLEFNALTSQIMPLLARLPARQPLPAALYRQMVSAVGIWNEDSFLAGDEISRFPGLERWQGETDRALENSLLPILKNLAEHDHLTDSNPESAVRWLTMALRFNEFDESLHERILQIYLEAGMQSRARDHYNGLEESFEFDLGSDLSPQIRALKARIFREPAFIPAASNPWLVKSSLQAPFTGQPEALEQVLRLSRTGGAMVIFGEAGAGKTRLVQEVYRRLAPQPRLLLATCHSLESNLPFSPWIGMLRASVSPEEWRALDSVWAGPLTLLLPELARLRPDLPPFAAEKPDIPRTVLVEAACQVLRQMAQAGPVFLFLDDADWADESTLAIVSYLLKESFFSQGQNTLIVAARIEERHPLLDKILLTAYPQRIQSLEIRHLNMDETAELAQHILGLSLPKEFIVRLRQDTGGNPFFLLETLQLLLGFSFDYQPVHSLPLPGSVREIIQQRIQNLSPQARELISIAAVLGSQFNLDVIEQVANHTLEDTAQALDELESVHLLNVFTGEGVVYDFVHEKIRESLLLDISPAHKRLIHQKAAAVLEKRFAGWHTPQASILAYHFEQAGNFHKAFDYWVMAGQYAYRLASLYEALDAFRRAEQQIQRASGLSEQQLYNLYSSWNQVAFENDDPDELERLSQALSSLGYERNSSLLIGSALTCQSDAAMARNQFAEALKYAQQGYPYISESGDIVELTRISARIGVFLYMLNRVRDSQEWFVKILVLTEPAVDRRLIVSRADAHYQLAITETLCGYPLQGMEHAKKSLEIYLRQQVVYGQVTALSVLGLANYSIGYYALGRESSLRGLALAAKLDGWRMYGYLSSYAGMCEVELGLLGQAWSHAQKAIEIGRQYEHSEIVGLGCKVMGDLYIRMGALNKATGFYQQGMLASGEHFVALENMYRYGFALYLQGQKETGSDFVQRASDLSSQTDLLSFKLYAVIYQLHILLDKGDEKSFDELAKWFRNEVSQRLGQDLAHHAVDRLLANKALKGGEYSQAFSLLEAPITTWYCPFEQRWLELNSLKVQVTALAAMGQDTASRWARIHELLDFIESNLGSAPVQAEWEAF